MNKKVITLLKTTEGLVILIGTILTLLSPVFGPKIWSVITALGYVLVNIPGVVAKIKDIIRNYKSGNKN